MLLILAFLFLAPSFADPLAYDAPIFTRDECSNDCSCPGRSVWDIVWSCLATTFAVTWISVHPNVPFLEESSWSLLKRRIFLMCLALLAPEVMIMWAFKQWRGAVMIRETINKARPKSCVQWTMAHAHFLQMGGFKVNYTWVEFDSLDVYQYQTEKEGILVEESVLRSYKFQELLEKQLIDFPDTTAKEIEDRSKGDALSKGVALLQITWFIIQLIARAHQHLTITEIELATAALAGLNSIMYLFWWNKPLDVRCPIVIRTKELERQLVEARKARNGENESRNEGGAESWKFTRERFRLRDYLRDSPAWVALDLAANTLYPAWMRTICCLITRFPQPIISALATHLQSFAIWLLKVIRALRHLIPHQTQKDANSEFELQSSTTVDESDVGSLQSSGYPATRSHFRRVVKSIKLVISKLFYLPYLLMFLPMNQILQPVVYDFSLHPFNDAKDKMHSKPALELLFNEYDMRWIMLMMFDSERAETRPLLIFSALAGAAFGSIHCAAWNFEFPSTVERILWRTASLTIVGLCLLIIAAAPVYTRFVYHKWYKSRGNKFRYWTRIKKTIETTLAIIYPVARLSLLILALLSLPRLPPSAFDTVVWTKFIPHI